MRILRQSNYSQFTAGLKGGLKGFGKGAMVGSLLMPGKLIALGKKNYKTAGILAGSGAILGGAVGARNGWKNNVSHYKYANDPEYRAKIDKENKEKTAKYIGNSLKEDITLSNSFSTQDWTDTIKKLKESGYIIPDDFIKYVRFFETTWKKKINEWYDAIPRDVNFYEVCDFKNIFPIPVSGKLSYSWFENDDPDEPSLVLLTDNSAGDDGFVCYNFNRKVYDWDWCFDEKSPKTLKELITMHVNDCLEEEYLSKKNIEIAKEFLNTIKTKL